MTIKQPTNETQSALDPASDIQPFAKLDLRPYGVNGEARLEDIEAVPLLIHVAGAEKPVDALEMLLAGYDLKNDVAQKHLAFLLRGGYSKQQALQPNGVYTRYVETPTQAMFNLTDSRGAALKFLASLDLVTQVQLLSNSILGNEPIIATLAPEELEQVDKEVIPQAISRYLTSIIPERDYGSGKRVHPTKLVDEFKRYTDLLEPEVFAKVLSSVAPLTAKRTTPSTKLWFELFKYNDVTKDLAVEGINYLLRVAPSEGLRILSEDAPQYTGDVLARIASDMTFGERGWAFTHFKSLFEGVEDAVVISALQRNSDATDTNPAHKLEQVLIEYYGSMIKWMADGMPDSLFQTLFVEDGQLIQGVKPGLKGPYLQRSRVNSDRNIFYGRFAGLVVKAEHSIAVLYELAFNDPETFGHVIANSGFPELNVTTALRAQDGTLSFDKTETLLTTPETADVLLSLDIDTLMGALEELCTGPERTKQVYDLVVNFFKKEDYTAPLTTRDVPVIHFYGENGIAAGDLRPSVVKFFSTVQEVLPDVIPNLDEHILSLEWEFYAKLTRLEYVWGYNTSYSKSTYGGQKNILQDRVAPFVTRMFFYDEDYKTRVARLDGNYVWVYFFTNLKDSQFKHREQLIHFATHMISQVAGSSQDLDTSTTDLLDGLVNRINTSSQVVSEYLVEDLTVLVDASGVTFDAATNSLRQMAREYPHEFRTLLLAFVEADERGLSANSMWFNTILTRLLASAIQSK